MAGWRSYPPVHAALSPRALIYAILSSSGTRAEWALSQARAALALRYPERELLLVNSGTAALQLAFSSTSRGLPNPCVALPAYACPDLGSAAIGAGFGILLYDVDALTLQPDYSSLRAALTAGATHVVVAHLFGRLVDVPLVHSLAAEFGARVIEDAAQHAGGTLHGVRGGALAPVSVLSFGRGKGLNAGGGGALLWESSAIDSPAFALAPALHAARQILVAGAVSVLSHPALYAVPSAIPTLGLGETHYQPPQLPRAMSGGNAALLTTALATELAALRARRAVETWYGDELAANAQLACARLDGSEGGALRFPVRIELARGHALARLGVARSYPHTLAEYQAIAAQLRATSPTPGASELAATLHTLPTHALLGEVDRRKIVGVLSEP